MKERFDSFWRVLFILLTALVISGCTGVIEVNSLSENGTSYATKEDDEDGCEDEDDEDDGSEGGSVPRTTVYADLSSTPVFPASGSTSAYADTYFTITFDYVPSINTSSTGAARIYKVTDDGETLVDTINVSDESLTMYGNGGNSSLGSIRVQGQLFYVSDKTLYIKPHFNSSGYEILDNDTKYRIEVDASVIKNYTGSADAFSWSFTTGSAPSISGNTINVGTSGDFITIQGAFNYLIKNISSGNWTINVAKGDYHERLAYKGTANVTLNGQGSSSFGQDVNVFWSNQNGTSTGTVWNNGSRGRVSFYWCGANLTLKNIAFTNTATRTDDAGGYNQAETLFYDSKKFLAAYNCSFESHQDTLNIGNTGGQAWFYKCYIQGDVDFVWGTADVCLLEECTLKQILSEKQSYLFETRVGSTSTAKVGKGYVLLNSTVSDDGGSNYGYLSRLASGNTASSPKASYDQVAVIGSTFTSNLSSDVWLVKTDYYPSYVAKDDDGNVNVGWKTYNNSGFTTVTADYAGEMTADLYNMEYNGRYTILNRKYDTSKAKYDFNDSVLDISSLESDFGASTDASTSNSYEVKKTIIWDFTSWDESVTCAFESSSGTVAGTVTGMDESYVLTVDASSGKFKYDSTKGRVQMNAGTKVWIPATEGSTIDLTFSSAPVASAVYLGGENITAKTFSLDVTSDMIDSDNGGVLLEYVSTGSSYYIYTIKVTLP